MHPVSVSYEHDYERVRFLALIVNKRIKLSLVISVDVTLRLGEFKAYRQQSRQDDTEVDLKVSNT